MILWPVTSPTESIDYLDIAFKIATISIAALNVFFAVRIFNLKNKKDDSAKEKDRKIQLLKTLVLDPNFKNFYLIFDEIEDELNKLKVNGLTVIQKQAIDATLADLFIKLRRKFYDSLLGIDESLYSNIETHSDVLQNHFTETIFDNGVNLSHSPKFDELITEKLLNTKTNIIKQLFSYRGD